MSFSDWIVIVSILFGVMLAVFKYDEWEIIRLKNFQKFIWLPIICLFFSGVAAYFYENPHPNFMDGLAWFKCGLRENFWAIIWAVLFFVSVYFKWKKFTNQKPFDDGKLVEKYNDYLDTYEPSKFSSLFRKYERYFFNSNDDDSWMPYELILTNKKWWEFAPSYFKEIVHKHPDRFHKMNTEVLKSLLTTQLTNIPNSQITQEIESRWNSARLNENTPILNIFLSTAFFIEKSRNRNIVLPSIKKVANEYFCSIQFLERDRKSFLIGTFR